MSFVDFPHARRLHVADAGIGVEGSSESSSSSGAGDADPGDGVGIAVESDADAAGPLDFGCEIGSLLSVFSACASCFALFSLACASDSAFSSIVECLPVVHGGISRNSSKVRTLGLQHFQPDYDQSRRQKNWVIDVTFLAFMKLWRSRMIYTWFIGIAEDFSTTLVYTLLRCRHFEAATIGVDCLSK